MITIPDVLQYKGITVFPDDHDPDLYYCIKNSPQLRLLPDGKPVFKALFWTDKADGTMQTTAGLAGGSVNFDVNLALTPEEEDAIKAELKRVGVQQKRIDEIRKRENSSSQFRDRVKELQAERNERLGNSNTSGMNNKVNTSGWNATGSQRVSSSPTSGSESGKKDGQTSSDQKKTPGEIRLGSINYTSGTVSVLEEGGGALVSQASSSGNASLLGDNNAAFALNLTDVGAAVWYKCLKEGDKAIGIRYDLKFMMSLPALEVTATANAYTERDLDKVIERWLYTKKKAGTIRERKTYYEVGEISKFLADESLISINVNKQSCSLDNKQVEEITASVRSMLDKKVQQICNKQFEEYSKEQQESTYLRRVIDEFLSSMEVHYFQNDVIEWSVSPQGTLLDFLEPVDKNERDAYLKLVDLADPIIQNMQVPVTVMAPWNEPPYVQYVGVDLKYTSKKGKEWTKSFGFTDPDKAAENWYFHTMPGDSQGDFKYRVYASFKNHQKQPGDARFPYETGWLESSGNVFVGIGKFGVLDLQVRPHPALANLGGSAIVTSLSVVLSYKVKGDNKTIVSEVVLDPNDKEGVHYLADLGKEVILPITYKAKYVINFTEHVETKEKKFYLTDDGISTIYAPLPFGTVDIPISLPFEASQDVSSVFVMVNYKDKGFQSMTYTYLLNEDGFKSAATLVIPEGGTKDFTYTYDFTMRKGTLSSKEPIKGTGRILIPMQLFQMHTDLLGLGSENKLVQLKLNVPSVGYADTVIIKPDDPSPVEVLIPSEKSIRELEIQYEMKKFPVSGVPVSSSGTWKGDDEVVIE